MAVSGDPEELAGDLGDRPVRGFPALLSSEAEAMAWARSGGPEGGVVVADYQAAPRGRGGLTWEVRPGRDLAFSVVLRPSFPPDREGWLYTVATSALADVLGPGATIAWPDEVRIEANRAAAVGVQVEAADPHELTWAVVSVLVPDAPQPRGAFLARVLEALEGRYGESAERVVADYLPRCETIGRTVRARLVPMGPRGPQVVGRAVASVVDGALILETGEGRRVAVRPQALGILEDPAGEEDDLPTDLFPLD